MTYSFRRISIFLLAVLGIVVLVSLSSAPHQELLFAAAPTRVDPTPLPTPTLHPTATSVPRTPVATIVLKTSTGDGTARLFSVVQWLDATGHWNDVEGWRGAIVDDQTIWWVEAKDWGTGPFRWVVYQPGEVDYLATSKPFHLPEKRGELKQIDVSW